MRAEFRKSLMLVVEHMLRTPALIRMHVVLRAEATGPEHPARAYFVERDRATLSWLAERIASFDSSPEPAARLVLAMMLGLQQHWVQEQCGFDLVTDWQRALAALIE